MRYHDTPDKPIDPLTDENVVPPGLVSHFDISLGRWRFAHEFLPDPEVPDYPTAPKGLTSREKFDARIAAMEAAEQIRNINTNTEESPT